MSFEIASLSALEILDSRSRPTLSVTIELAGGVRVSAGVPSGASTGTREAVELRDGDPARFSGAGVTIAVGNVNHEIAEHLVGRSLDSLAQADEAMRTLDGTANKARLGANAIVGVSMALARALAAADGQPLHAWLPGFGQPARLPVPCFNVLNGGAHAPNPLDFQEFMVCPLGAPSMAESVRAGAEVYAALRKRLVAGGHATGLGDEGGFAPDLTEPEDVLAMIVAAIEDAGYTPGSSGVAIALDPAASEFRQHDGTYRVAGQSLSSTELIERYAAMVDAYPIWSIEDGLGESDHDGWQQLTGRLGDRIQLVGDDNFCTNPAIIADAISDGIANAALIKLNQIGTVTETLEAMAVCHRAGYAQMVSHRSGETPDTFIADLAVATGCGQLKTGAPARGERVAKYNRLIEIAVDRPDLPFGRP
ncbi:phosphopyruvate hydratase [Humibacillus sp. DSM 29435]|uniref:phosphopyruvate hydratase n=1 Tax=Humibacillus sp. DSM 29435 TaxID=1869167 RepID=UPI000872ECFE|nr:phosphopyruvate hydratase [Humibacillus sp. DSM 29435]OFE15562.1 phosphopyruvate hydratase [Humibacillus sp. DSM 29435]